MAGRPTNSPRGLFHKDKIAVGSGGIFSSSYSATAAAVTFNTTGIIAPGSIRLTNKANGVISGNATGMVVVGGIKLGAAQITANSTAVTLPGALKLSGKSTATVTANTTAVIVSALRVGALASYITVNTTGIRIGTRYISTNTTGNSAT